jgi:hypothetical protein
MIMHSSASRATKAHRLRRLIMCRPSGRSGLGV